MSRREPFDYFDFQLGRPDWSRALVLDFGGSRGDLVAGSGGAIDPSRYWNVDVSREAIEAGARRIAQGHFVHFNRWHYCYNPNGNRHEPLPQLGERFDFILAFSVFTLVDERELVELVTGLRSQLADGGVLAFTFIDPSHRKTRKGRVISNLEWRLEIAAEHGVAIEPETLALAASQTASCYLIEQRWIESAARLRFETFLTAEHVRSLFPGCEILAPTAEVRHHCCVMTSKATYGVR